MRIVRAGAVAIALVGAACEGPDAHMTAPHGAESLARFTVIGGGFAMGVQTGGIVATSQAVGWPAQIAADAHVDFRQPLFRAPGCSPPLASPLLLGRWLSGGSTVSRDSSCAGTAGVVALPADNLAIAGATAWDALYLTPRIVTAASASYDILDRLRYPAVLATTQSQETAMLVKSPTFIAVELGIGEVMRAATSGRVVTAAAYDQPSAWTLIPFALFAVQFDAIADSLAKTRAKVAILSVPRITRFPAFRPAAQVWATRAALDAFGVAVSADCSGSSNVLHVATIVSALVQRAIATGARQTLSCADVPGAADNILTAADAGVIETTIDQINARLAQVASARGWAFASLDDTYAGMIADAASYVPAWQQTCASPYGSFISLDGIHPTGAGHRRIADAVAAAINATYGFALPSAGAALDLRAAPCS